MLIEVQIIENYNVIFYDRNMGLTKSVPRSMQRMVTVPRGKGMLNMMKNKNGVISGMLDVRV